MTPSCTIAVAKDVTLLKNVLIPVRDGTHLAADLYMPANSVSTGKFPVVLEYIPYRKDEVNYSWRDFYLVLPRHGYVVARVDIRGTGASEGVSTDEYMLQEQFDGYDVIEWLAQQPWCSGQVNMMGISYGGFTALQVASHNPPHLTSIIPIDFTDDRYTDECHYRGGLLRKYYNIANYGSMMIAMNALPPYPEWSGKDWMHIWEQHLEHNEPYLLKWYHHQTNDNYWRHGSVRDAPERIKCPVFMIGGWWDGYPNPPLRLYQALAHVPRKVLIGPWNHAMPDMAIPGPRIDYLHEVVRWLDYWCKDKATGIMDEPPVAIYMQYAQPPKADRLESAGEWRAETSWPPPDVVDTVLYLNNHNLLGTTPSYTKGAGKFEYNPTVGLAGGLWSGGIQFGLPGDQRADEALSLVYTTPPLKEDLYVLGRPQAVLYISSSASVVGFAASLSNVAPNGASQLVAKGMLNATRRQSLQHPKPLVPGQVYELNIELDTTGWVFKKGHCIRLSIASADWPNVWPTPEPATNQVYYGPHHLSRLVLPTVPAQGSAAPPRYLPSPKTVQKHSDKVNPPTWKVMRDMLTERTTVNIANTAKRRINNTTTFEYTYSSTFQVDPNNPAQASAHGSHTYRIVRPNHKTQSRADTFVQATATHFYLMINLEVRVNNMLYRTKQWADSIPRQYL